MRYQVSVKSFFVSVLLAFSLITLLSVLLLASDKSHVNASLPTTLISAATAIVTSCFLSIGKKLYRSMRQSHQVPQSDYQKSEDQR